MINIKQKHTQRQKQRADEDAYEPPCVKAAEEADEYEQHMYLAALGDEHGLDDVVYRADDEQPPEQKDDAVLNIVRKQQRE